MVVAVGLTDVVPLADVDVNVPGVMEMLVAPVAAQLRVLLEPGAMLVGLAEKDVIAGAVPFPEDEPDEVPETQPEKPPHAIKANTTAQNSTLEELSLRKLSLFPQNERGESICDPFGAADRTILQRNRNGCAPKAKTAFPLSDLYESKTETQPAESRACSRAGCGQFHDRSIFERRLCDSSKRG